MILKDGTEITSVTASHKYGNDGMAEYLHGLAMEGGSDYAFGDSDAPCDAAEDGCGWCDGPADYRNAHNHEAFCCAGCFFGKVEPAGNGHHWINVAEAAAMTRLAEIIDTRDDGGWVPTESIVTIAISADAFAALVSFLEDMADGPGYLRSDGATTAATLLAAIRSNA